MEKDLFDLGRFVEFLGAADSDFKTQYLISIYMKTKNIIQRLCLFLFVLVLAAPAVATNYGREGYETFRSRELGKHKTVTTLRKGKVEITFSSCTTSGSSGNGAIYQPAKGSRITIKTDDGYAIRWIILRDTEGGERYSHGKATLI